MYRQSGVPAAVSALRVVLAVVVIGLAAGWACAALAAEHLPGTWASTHSMSIGRGQHTATLLRTGEVLVVGGATNRNGSTAHLATAEVYHPGPGRWSPTGSLAEARMQHTATLLPDGEVLVAGGCCGGAAGASQFATAEVYHPATGKWSATGSLASGRGLHTATLLPSGKVLVVGGANGGGPTLTIFATAELYDPASGTWSPTGSMQTGRFFHTATLLPSGKVLVVGGGDFGDLATAELYDPATGTWSPTGSMVEPRQQHTATLLRTGKVLVAGGVNGAFNNLATAELYDPVLGTWLATGSMATPRRGYTATLLADGNVLVAGGLNNGPNFVSVLALAERYDPATGTWSPTGSLIEARWQHTATLLRNQEVLVIGGVADTFRDYLATGERYSRRLNGQH